MFQACQIELASLLRRQVVPPSSICQAISGTVSRHRNVGGSTPHRKLRFFFFFVTLRRIIGNFEFFFFAT